MNATLRLNGMTNLDGKKSRIVLGSLRQIQDIWRTGGIVAKLSKNITNGVTCAGKEKMDQFERNRKLAQGTDLWGLTKPRRQVDANVRALTPAQKRELERLRAAEGYLKIYDARTYNIFCELRKKGFVRLEAGWGQLQRGTHVYLIE